MNFGRRNFIKSLALSSLVLGASPSFAFPSKKRLKILVLGGTNFLGPAIVNAGLKNGHLITLLNRGITNPTLFSDIPLIKGDRETGEKAYKQAKKQKWDAVIDVWPEKSALVKDAVNAFRNRTSHYLFISSIAVYNNFQEVGLNEKSDVVKPDPDITKWNYPDEKIESENIVGKNFRKNHTILRPGPIKGWGDSELDLLYWLNRLRRNKDILAPGTGKDPLQFIDVRDVGRFAIQALENRLVGVYNTTGPTDKPLLWTDFLSNAKKDLKSDSKIYWPGEEFLRKNNVRSFDDLPLWAPLSEDRGFMQISADKARAAGFQFTPAKETIGDCLKWFDHKSKNDPEYAKREKSTGLTRSRELQLLEQLSKARNT